MIGTLGTSEMIVIFLLALVLFGPNKLPELGRTIGKAVTEFRRASSELKATLDREMQTLERESEQLSKITEQTAYEVFDHASRGLPSGESLWNAIEEPVSQPVAQSASQAAIESASATSGAESNGTAATAVLDMPAEPMPEQASSEQPAIEGTVPRTGTTNREPAPETVAVAETSSDTTQHS